MLLRLKSLGTPADRLMGISTQQQQQLENVQKGAWKVILDPAYINYDDTLTTLSLPKLSARYREAMEKLGKGLLRYPRLRHLLLPDAPRPVLATRHQNKIMSLRPSRADRCHHSETPTMVRATDY
ncbi:hypothetical protein E2C01_086112 [Portunus trituberculatus]|uniref:Uncharacterized protein n=1 Tax=Portunus trituberculatus TaxID=210409 RepID=A0A5B7JCK4_PORTR|nr:hypothetical protein [Portunus trituberculatus]